MTQVIIPCSGPKKTNAPTFHIKGSPIEFAANPICGRPNQRRPWDPIVPGGLRTWVHCVADYNNLGLLHRADIEAGVGITGQGTLWCAGTLYTNSIYADLIRVLEFDNVYILSAGWGLIRAAVKIPPYDITFSKGQNVPQHAKITVPKRTKGCLLVDAPHGSGIWIFAGNDYVSFLKRISPIAATSNIETRTDRQRTNWYYKPARDWALGLRVAPVPRNGPCPCICNFADSTMCCGHLPSRHTIVVQ